ncbi:MAG: AraC family transcriptional regulator [Janthinobacterium lividum]
MIEPLAEVVTLLQPAARLSKIVTGAGRWGVRRSEIGQSFYCAILDGSCRLTVDGHAPLVLQESDFVLIPAAYDFTTSSLAPPEPGDVDTLPVALRHGEYSVGTQGGPPDVRLLIGYCRFGSPDAALPVSLLPRLVHVRGERRLTTLVQLVNDESRATRPAREVVLVRLLEVLLIEALRSTAGMAAAPGLLRGLADTRLAAAIRRTHESPARNRTVADLAKEAALSRSAFFARFNGALGVAPMEYLLAWRMALAKDLLRLREHGIAEIAEIAARVGYSSASTFSVAFARFAGCPPARYAQAQTVPG